MNCSCSVLWGLFVLSCSIGLYNPIRDSSPIKFIHRSSALFRICSLWVTRCGLVTLNIVLEIVKYRCLTSPSHCTHSGRLTHICVSELYIIGSDNGLSPVRRQAIIWNNTGILLIGTSRINSREIFIKIYTFSFMKMHFKNVNQLMSYDNQLLFV